MTIKELIEYGIAILKKENIEDANFKVKQLLAYVLKVDNSYFITNESTEVFEEVEKKYIEYLNEIVCGKPLQYITNKQEFMGLEFWVNEDVLIPQPDTEILVEETIKQIRTNYIEKNDKIRILDLCTGSGAIAISIGKCLQQYSSFINEKVEIYATDISKLALGVAQKNAIKHQVPIKFVVSDMFQNITEKFDIIVSNPPYIEKNVIPALAKDVQNEPYIALDGGVDGLDFYRIIAKDSYLYINNNGMILLEIGYNQKHSVTKLFEQAESYKQITCIKDLSGNDRVVKIEVQNK